MNIIISNSGEKPIYEQIETQLKAMIVGGELSEGDLLPSIRQLAKDLRISVITTKRAYDELERGGFITSVTGKGSFVAGGNLELLREEKLKSVERYLLSAAEEGKIAGVSLAEMVSMLKLLYEEKS